MLKQEIQMSVGNFDSLDKYTKMYIAQAMGVSDVAEAQRLLNMSTAEYQSLQSRQQKSADIQKELADATKELVPLMQQLKLAGIQVFMAFKPVISFFTGFIGVLSEVVGFIGGLVQGIGDFIGVAGEGGAIMERVLGAITAGFIAFKVGLLAAMGPLGLVVLGLGSLWAIFHKKGSPELWELPNHAGEGYEAMANSMGAANEAALATSASMKGVHDSMHKAGGKSFSIESMAKLDTTKIATGITKVKSALMELSTLKIDGFLAMSTDGTSTSMIMGSESLIKNISEGKLTVEVKMPKFEMPNIDVRVFIGNEEFKTYVRTEAAAVYAGRS
jgi:hypothetical protein